MPSLAPIYLSEMFGRLLRTPWTGENGAQMLAEELYAMGQAFANGQPVVMDSPLVLRQSGSWPALSIVRTSPLADWQPTQLVDQPPGGFYGPVPTFTPVPYSFNTPTFPDDYQPSGPSYYGGSDFGGGGINLGGVGGTTITLPPLPPLPPSPNLPPINQPGINTPSTPLFQPDGGPVGPPIGGGGGSGGAIVGRVKSGGGSAYKVDAYLDTTKSIADGATTTVDATARGLSEADLIDAGTWVTLSKYGGGYDFTPTLYMTGS